MRQYMMVIFGIIVSLVYGGLSWYLYSRGIQGLEGSKFSGIFTWSFWTLTITFIIGQVLERGNPGTIATVLSQIGSMWLVVFAHLLMFVLVVDLIRVIHHYTNFIPESMLTGIFAPGMLFIYGIGIASLITIGGAINARNPIIKNLSIETSKGSSQVDSLRVVLATDVHLGVILGNNHAKKLVKQINEQKADLVLFGGDLVDHNPNPVLKNDMGRHFEKINSKYGTYAITGNHEFMGDPEVVIKYFKEHNVQYIRESIHTVNGVVQIAGRDDRDKSQFAEEKRIELDSLLKNKTDLPLILIDHQPLDYNIAAEQGVNLMVSGHTHKGQIWPLSFVTNAIYENHFGLIKKMNTWFYTSSGYGTWGPPVRTGNRPELVVIDMKFK